MGLGAWVDPDVGGEVSPVGLGRPGALGREAGPSRGWMQRASGKSALGGWVDIEAPRLNDKRVLVGANLVVKDDGANLYVQVL